MVPLDPDIELEVQDFPRCVQPLERERPDFDEPQPRLEECLEGRDVVVSVGPPSSRLEQASGKTLT